MSELFHPEISLIGNRQQIISFISCLDNIDYSSLDWSNPNRIELAKYIIETKLENTPTKINKKTTPKNNNKIEKKDNNNNYSEKEFHVTLHLFVSGKNCYNYTKRNALNGSIDFEKNDGIIYFIDSFADKKNFGKFTTMLENDLYNFQKNEVNFKEKIKNIFIIGNRFNDKDKKIQILSKEIAQFINSDKYNKNFVIKFIKIDFPFINNNEENEIEEIIKFKSSYKKENVTKLMNEITRISFKRHLEKKVTQSIKINITGDMDNLHLFLSNYFNDSTSDTKYYIKKLVNTGVERRNKIDFIEKEPIKICLNGIRIEYIKIDLFGETYPSDIVIFLVTIKKYEESLKYLTKLVNDYIKERTKGNNEKLKEKLINLKFYVFFDQDDNDIKTQFENVFKSSNNLIINYKFKFIVFENSETLNKAIEEVLIEKNL